MPNTGMLDHRAFKSESHRNAYVYWMGAWPSKAGYQTARSLRFSRHLLRQSYKAQVRERQQQHDSVVRHRYCILMHHGAARLICRLHGPQTLLARRI